MEIKHKLQHLVPHWIEHNQAHAAAYGEWAKKASEAGLDQVASGIQDAVAAVEKANEALLKALGQLG